MLASHGPWTSAFAFADRRKAQSRKSETGRCRLSIADHRQPIPMADGKDTSMAVAVAVI
jgi:hypothetical protein